MMGRHTRKDCPQRDNRSRLDRIIRQQPQCYGYDHLCDRGYIRPWFVITCIVGAVMAVVGGAVLGGNTIARHYSEQGCVNYGAQTDRDVRWVDASWFDYGCYVEWNDTWIPRDDYTRITFGGETGVES